MPGKIFMSYRRDDSAGHAGRVHDRLVAEFGRDVLFMDVDAIPLGSNFVKVLEDEVGKCDGPSFESAGAHFNPTRAEHGTSNPRGPHAGDLPDVTVNSAGKGHLEVSAKLVTLDKKSPASLLDSDGSAIVIHERADDKRTGKHNDAFADRRPEHYVAALHAG